MGQIDSIKNQVNTTLLEEEKVDTVDDGWNVDWQSPRGAIIVKDEPKVKI